MVLDIARSYRIPEAVKARKAQIFHPRIENVTTVRRIHPIQKAFQGSFEVVSLIISESNALTSYQAYQQSGCSYVTRSPTH